MSGNPPPGVPENLLTPQGNMPAIGIPNSQDYARLIFAAPYFDQIPIAEIIQPSVTEAVEAALPSLVPQYVDAAAQAAVQQLAVLLTGSTMTGPLFLSPIMPTQPSQAATMAYVDAMISTAGIPEVPPVPSGQVWARETGQWVPITPQTGVFLPLAGGSMVGNINMSGNTIQNMAAVPAMPNGAAPATWVLNQIASVSLYQGTWNADNNVPDLTQLSTHVNGYTWIAITTAVDGVVIGPAIPGLQGQTIYNGDTIIYSTVQGSFMSIHAGGLTLPEADARYVQLGGSQMSGALLLNANASQPLQAVTFQQLQAFVPPGAVGEAPNDGQLYGRNGLTASWSPVLPLAGGILTGMITLSGNATQALQPATYGQMNSAITAATAPYLPLSGAAMTGLMTLSGNAIVGLNPVSLQQLTAMLASYATTASVTAGFLALSGGTLTGALAGTTASFSGNVTGNAFVTGTATTSGVVYHNQWLVTPGAGSGGGTAATPSPISLGYVPVGADPSVPSSGWAGVLVQTGNAAGSTFLLRSTWTPGTSAPVHAVTCSSAITSMTAILNGTATAGWSVVASDSRLKQNLAMPSVDALGVVNAVKVYQADYQHPAAETGEHLDFTILADDIETALPGAYMAPPDENGYASLHPIHMIAALWRAVQQLSDKIEARA